jgi:hypothetical protein
MLADGTRLLTEARVLHTGRRFTPARAICILLAVWFGVSAGTQGRRLFKLWQASESAGLPGASWLHLPTVETARLRLISNSIKANCHTVLNLPGLYSFAVWTGVEPKEHRRINSWPFLFGEDALIRELRALKGGDCVLVSDGTLELFRILARYPASLKTLQLMRPKMTVLASTDDAPVEKLPTEGKRITLYQLPLSFQVD